MRLDVFDLFVDRRGAWRGWRVQHDGQRFRQTPVLVTDLLALPPTARVYVESMRWRRP